MHCHAQRATVESHSKMKISLSTLILGLVLVGIGQLLGEEQTIGKVEKSLCPMVATPAKEGLFQLIEVIGVDGKVGVGEPKEKVRLKCTIINLTKRSLMVAEDYVTPQYGSMIVHGRDSDVFPEAQVPAITPVDNVLMSSSVDFPRRIMDWGHIRNWSHIAASHDLECGCCIRHRQYTKWLDLQLPEGEWSTITLELTQWSSVIFLGPEERSYLKSSLVLTIKRRSEQDGAGQSARRPESESEDEEKPQPELERRSR